MAHCFFQYTFAATTTSIVKGSVHERCSNTAYICYTVLISGFIYPIGCYWALSENGWLKVLGFEDYAGSGLVHALGGAASLAATHMTGPRQGRFNKKGKMNNIPAHSMPQAALGSFFFVLGMIAFNAGSRGSITNPGDGSAIARIVINTVVCVAVSTATTLIFHRFVVKRSSSGWDFDVGLNGSFIGMVVICAGCNEYQLWVSVVVGFLSYFVYLGTQKAIQFAKIDDPVGGLGVQMGGGFFGLMFVALFKDDGLIFRPSQTTAQTLLANTLGGIIIMIWSYGTIAILYAVLRYFDLHCVTMEDEDIGLDLTYHKQTAYCCKEPSQITHRANINNSTVFNVQSANRSQSVDSVSRRAARRIISVTPLET